MKIIYNPVFLEHDTGMHPENKKRLEVVQGLVSTEIVMDESTLTLVHTPGYVQKVKDACEKGIPLDQDTVTSKGSFKAALAAANATVMASRSGDLALVRPPGHHAYPDHSSGFCLFNNIAIAVQKLVDEGKRVLIFDFDGHLGDGTSKYFYKTDKVMYWSLHQYPAFPNAGTEDEIGEDAGFGFTLPVPLPPGSGDDIFMDALERFLPVAKQFNPDIVAVSAGFDAHQYDLLLDLKLSLNAFYSIGKFLKENFHDVFATLEGGYNVEVFQKCLYNFLDGYNGYDKKHIEEPTESIIQVHDEYENRMYRLEENLRKRWKI